MEGNIQRAGAEVGEGQIGRVVCARLKDTDTSVLRPGNFLTVEIPEPQMENVAVIPAFGFFIVLLIVPSFVVIHHDLLRLWHTFRRSLSGRRLPPLFRPVLWLAVLSLVVINLATVGLWVVSGHLAGPLAGMAEMVPSLSGGPFLLWLRH